MRIGTVLVSGPSMVPTLRSGDCLLIWHTRRIRSGDLVVARFRDRPDLLVVKRADRAAAGGWFVTSDNPFGNSASGVADVEARVLFRYWRRPA